MQDLPQEIWQLCKLRVLSLENLSLNVIPTEVTQLKELRELRLYKRKLIPYQRKQKAYLNVLYTNVLIIGYTK